MQKTDLNTSVADLKKLLLFFVLPAAGINIMTRMTLPLP